MSSRLPKLERGQELRDAGIEATQHFTEPPPRFTEATLIREMERLGIGRPSTYASTMSLLREREYVKLEKKRLEPEDKGRLVTTFLEAFFKRYVEYDFTAYLEDRLDQVSDGKLDWKELLARVLARLSGGRRRNQGSACGAGARCARMSFWVRIFSRRKRMAAIPRLCPLCGSGPAFAEDGQIRRLHRLLELSRMPVHPPAQDRQRRRRRRDRNCACRYHARHRSRNGLDRLSQERTLWPVYSAWRGRKRRKAKTRFPSGRYRAGAGEPRIRACSSWRFPREVGIHPESGKPIQAGFGRYGPYLEHDGKYIKIDAGEVLTAGLNRAVALIADAAANGQGKAGRTSTPIKVLGEHPALGGKVEVLSGRYGPYIKFGKVNATLPKDMAPEAVTMDDAVKLIAARMESGSGKKKSRRARQRRQNRKQPAPAENPRRLNRRRTLSRQKRRPRR